MFFDLFKNFPFGLDISDFSIEALQLEKKFGKLHLGAYGRVELEKGIVEDGKILSKEKLKEKIIELLRTTVPRRFKTDQVILSLPESKNFLHIFKLPADITSRKDLTNRVEEQALKVLPLDADKIYFDFQVISRTKEFQEILYVATFKEIATEYIEVLRSVGLKTLVLDVESASLIRAFKNEETRDGGILIIDIGTRITVLTIFDKGSVRLSSIVPVAGDHFTRAISEKLNVPLEKAEEFKRSYGLDPEKEEGKTMLILQKTLQLNILDKIRELISFYKKKSKRKIKKVLLCGGSSFIPKISIYLSSNLSIKTLVPDPWRGINVEKLFKKKKLRNIITTKLHPIFFANVIGLAKRGLEKNPKTAGINLIPKKRRVGLIKGEFSKNKVFSLLIIGFTITAFTFLGWVIYNYILKAL